MEYNKYYGEFEETVNSPYTGRKRKISLEIDAGDKMTSTELAKLHDAITIAWKPKVVKIVSVDFPHGHYFLIITQKDVKTGNLGKSFSYDLSKSDTASKLLERLFEVCPVVDRTLVDSMIKWAIESIKVGDYEEGSGVEEGHLYRGQDSSAQALENWKKLTMDVVEDSDFYLKLSDIIKNDFTSFDNYEHYGIILDTENYLKKYKGRVVAFTREALINYWFDGEDSDNPHYISDMLERIYMNRDGLVYKQADRWQFRIKELTKKFGNPSPRFYFIKVSEYQFD